MNSAQEMGIVVLQVQVMIQILFALCFFTISCCYSAIPHSDPIERGISAGSNAHYYQEQDRQKIIDAKGGPEDVVWVVQLSDLHFSVHHPERARDFRDFVGFSLSFVNPSLVLITGDLTDGKSKDLLTMKQDEAEWVEYEKAMQDVIDKSGLNKDIFHDLRGNHDAFGVPSIGSLFDFFSKHSINGQLGRSGQVNSVTVQSCRALVKAYDMNPFLHFPVYSLTMPVLLAYVIYKTGRM